MRLPETPIEKSDAVAALMASAATVYLDNGYSSLASALEDCCLAMVRDYERDDLLELAPPGLS